MMPQVSEGGWEYGATLDRDQDYNGDKMRNLVFGLLD